MVDFNDETRALFNRLLGVDDSQVDSTQKVKDILKAGNGDLMWPGYAEIGSSLSINVKNKDYGAVGDGITDDRPAIQAALDAAGVGGVVYFPPGIYLLSTFTVPSDRILLTYRNQTLHGSGRFASTLKVAKAIGDYKTVIGSASDSDNCGQWSITDIGINQNGFYNPLTINTMFTYPRMAIRIGSYAKGSVVSIRDCALVDGDSTNALYVFADIIDISSNYFLEQGGPIGTAQHDHSSIYSSTTTAEGTQSIIGNTLRGVLSSGGSRTGIETHGGAQTVTGNAISGYITGMNLTGVSSPSPTDSMVCTGNTVKNACIGIHVWSYYYGTLTDGIVTRNVILSGNSIMLNRDAWSGISGYLAYSYGILVNNANSAPVGGLTIADNTITYLPTTSVVSGDYRSTGINVDISDPSAIIYDLNIRGNTIVNPLSAGMYLAGIIKRGRVVENTVVDPAQSNDVTVSTTYRAGIVLNRKLEDVGFERNLLIDTRPTHYAEYNIITAGLSSAIGCWTRHNTIRYADGAGARCAFFPSAPVAGTEFIIDEGNTYGALPPFNTKVGSKVFRINTGQILTQVTAPVGTTWKTSLALGATVASTAPSAGAGSALPATPAGYITANINGTDRQIAYY